MNLDEYQRYVRQLSNKNVEPEILSEKELQIVFVNFVMSAIKIGVNIEQIAEDSLIELVRERYDG